MIGLEDQRYVATSSFNNAINVWDIEHGTPVKKPCKNHMVNYIKHLDKEHTKVNRLSWDPFTHKQFISGSADTYIKLWDIGMD